MRSAVHARVRLASRPAWSGGDKSQEALPHKTADYVEAFTNHSGDGQIRRFMLASDDDEPYSRISGLLPSLTMVHVPNELWKVKPHQGKLLAAKVIENIHSSDAARGGAAPEQDEGQLLMAQAYLLAGANLFVGTLTSNYGLMVHDLMQSPALAHVFTRPHGDRSEHISPGVYVDLDGNEYYSCSIKDSPPWGALYGRAGYIYADLNKYKTAQER